nr:MAG TPA: hypothetical protein [Caudoviricetes sp.]
MMQMGYLRVPLMLTCVYIYRNYDISQKTYIVLFDCNLDFFRYISQT